MMSKLIEIVMRKSCIILPIEKGMCHPGSVESPDQSRICENLNFKVCYRCRLFSKTQKPIEMREPSPNFTHLEPIDIETVENFGFGLIMKLREFGDEGTQLFSDSFGIVLRKSRWASEYEFVL